MAGLLKSVLSIGCTLIFAINAITCSVSSGKKVISDGRDLFKHRCKYFDLVLSVDSVRLMFQLFGTVGIKKSFFAV